MGVNTHRANDLVWEAYQNKRHLPWREFIDGSREVKINNETRLDFKFINKKGRPHYIEIKSVTLCEGQVALFPDAVTTRGRKHLVELMTLMNSEVTCEILFVVQRTDCIKFSPAESIDQKYSELLREAHKKGVIAPTSKACVVIANK